MPEGMLNTQLVRKRPEIIRRLPHIFRKRFLGVFSEDVNDFFENQLFHENMPKTDVKSNAECVAALK